MNTDHERLEAMIRLLLDSGDMTPMAARQLRSVLKAESPDPRFTEAPVRRGRYGDRSKGMML